MRLAQPHTFLALVTLSLVACARRPAPATPAQLRRAIDSAPHLEVEVHGVLHDRPLSLPHSVTRRPLHRETSRMTKMRKLFEGPMEATAFAAIPPMA